MPPPMRYPEKLLVRLPEGTRDRIEAVQADDKQLADTQRRVILAGLEVIEASQKSPQKPNKRQRRVSSKGEGQS